jgi:transposase
VELFERIRRDHDEEGLSIRALADRHGVHRRTVRQALDNAVPPERKVAERDRPVLGAYEEVIRGWLRADKDAPPKQRHTAKRVWQRLEEEHAAALSYSTVRDFVREVRKELAAEQLPAVTIVEVHTLMGWGASATTETLMLRRTSSVNQRMHSRSHADTRMSSSANGCRQVCVRTGSLAQCQGRVTSAIARAQHSR